MPEITAHMNEKAKEQGLELELTVAELTTNFLAEGGILAVKSNYTEGLDGFSYAGIDTFMDRYQELTPWLHPCIRKENVTAKSNTNEKGEKVKSITGLTLIQAAYANAAMYAAGKARLERHVKRTKGLEIDSLSETQSFYWATMYYNAGEGTARKRMARDEHTPRSAKGECVLVEKTEAASGLICWDGKRLRWSQRGD